MATIHGYPHEHLGFLTPAQVASLDEFKALLIQEDLLTTATTPTHKNSTLLRFLRARRFQPADALKQFRATEKWREENHLDDLYMNIDVDEYDKTRRYYTHSTGRRDRRGVPVYLFDIGKLDSRTMHEYSGGRTKLLSLFATFENLAGWASELATVLNDRPNPEVPITQSINIVDIRNVGLRQFWSLKSHMQDATVLASSHYPELLDRIFIVGAPSFFPTVWSWVKGIFDPVTASKIYILSEAEVFETLTEYIAPENLPKQYGGGLAFEFGDLPTIDPAYSSRLIWKDESNAERRWPKGPTLWIKREDGNWDLMAVGSSNGQPRREIVATLLVGENPGGSADSFV